MPCLLDTYYSRYHCFIGADGTLYIHGSNGAEDFSDMMCNLAPDGKSFEVLMEIGMESFDEETYEFFDAPRYYRIDASGNKTVIGEAEAMEEWERFPGYADIGAMELSFVSLWDATASAHSMVIDDKTSHGDAIRATGNLNVRSSPDLSGKSLGSIKKGETLEYLGEDAVDDRGVVWHKVSYKDKAGWVSSRYSELTSAGSSNPSGPSVPAAGVNETSYALVTDTYTKNGKNYATFDYVELHFYSPGKKNAKGKVMDHDGVDIVNNNPKLRTYEIAGNCAFTMPFFYSYEYVDLSENQPVDYQHFKSHYADIAYGNRPMIFHVTVKNSQVVKCELWYNYYIGG